MSEKLSNWEIGARNEINTNFILGDDLSRESIYKVKELVLFFDEKLFDKLTVLELEYFWTLKYENIISSNNIDKSRENKCAIENSKEGLSDFLRNPRDGFFLVENLNGQIVEKIEVFKDFDVIVLGKKIKEFLSYTDIILPKFVFQGKDENVPKSEADVFNIDSLSSWILDFPKEFDVSNFSIIAENIWKIWKFKKRSFSLDVGNNRSKSMRLDESDLSSFENLFSTIQKSAVLNIFVKKGLSVKKIT